MSFDWVRFAVRVTHIPTGFQAEADSKCHRTMHRAIESCKRVVVADYVLPDGVVYPEVLEDYRKMRK